MLTPLFFLLSWPIRQKVHGPTVVVNCENCRNDTLLHLVKERRWLELFFIPVFPLGRADWLLLCEICGAGYELPREDVSGHKTASSLLERYYEGDLSSDAYRRELQDLRAQLATPELLDPTIEATTDVFADHIEEARQQATCPDCETEIGPTAEYCPQCGADVRPDVSVECSDCGETQPPDNEYCIKCGSELAPVAEW